MVEMAPPIEMLRPPLEYIFPSSLGVDLIYSFVIVLCSIMIYYATKEMYELSSYKGLSYFRKAFLFFAIAYFFRYSIRFILFIFEIKDIIDISPKSIGWLSMFIFLYSSSMAIFFLLYSVMWKKWNHNKQKIYVFNILAILIAFIGAVSRSRVINLIIYILLLIFISFVLFIAYKDSKTKQKGKSLYFIYFLLFLFWILYILEMMIPRFLEMFRIFIYIPSIFLFMIILYKVLKKSGN